VVNVPLRRKIIRVGKTSKAVILPEDWLTWVEEKFGEAPSEVDIEVDEELKIKPVIRAELAAVAK
jgi:antitoxin component of MazEF toxin-antitoxin module